MRVNKKDEQDIKTFDNMNVLRKVLKYNYEEAKERLVTEREQYLYYQAEAQVLKALITLVESSR